MEKYDHLPFKCSLKSFATRLRMDWLPGWVQLHGDGSSRSIIGRLLQALLPGRCTGWHGCENEGKWAARKKLDDQFILILEMTQKSLLQKLNGMLKMNSVVRAVISVMNQFECSAVAWTCTISMVDFWHIRMVYVPVCAWYVPCI